MEFEEKLVLIWPSFIANILFLIRVKPNIRFGFRRASAKNKSFVNISVSPKKWPNFRPELKQPVLLKSNLAIKHFLTFDLYYHA